VYGDLMKTSARAIVYSRVSTGKQADSGISLVDQLAQATAAAEARGWEVVHHAQDAGLSGKRGSKRPGLSEALDMLDRGEADVLVASKLDRLSRSTIDFADVLERSQRKGWSVVVLDHEIDTSTANGRLLLGIMVQFAQYERELIGERVAASHRVRRERGQRAGQLPELPDAIRARIASEVGQGTSLRTIADALNRENVPTARGGIWHASTVRHVARSVALEHELAAARSEAA
jgi:DNA invertase Pin-like site-specific DNA recombinase